MEDITKTKLKNIFHWSTHPSKWKYYPTTQGWIAIGIWTLVTSEAVKVLF